MTWAPPAGVTVAERAVYLDTADALVLADLHVGRDATSNVSLPLGERVDLRERLAALLERFEPQTVVFAGDLLHAFDNVPDGVPETIEALVDLVADAGATLAVTPGNHDGLLDTVLDGDVICEPEFQLTDGTVVCHGHELPTERGDADLYVVGHEHPAIVIEGVRRPCFLFGPGEYEGVDVLVLPAFSRLAAGTPINGLWADSALSPLLANPDNFRPIVASNDEPLAFPPLDDLRGML